MSSVPTPPATSNGHGQNGAQSAAAALQQEESANRGYARHARLLTVAIGLTGLMTAAYFVIASHVLTPVEAKRVDLLWAIMWVTISVIYRPIEQLLSRTIAHRRAHGFGRHPLMAAMLLQATFATVFVAFALAFRNKLQNDAFDGSAALYWILIAGVIFYAASYFARGWLAGHQQFGLYGTLVFMESASRVLFALAVALGFAHGQTAVAFGIAAAPFVSLCVIPMALASREREPKDMRGPRATGSGRESTAFALSVAGIMLAEQALLNAPVITVELAVHDAVLAGIVFNILLIARAPLQLFQAIQTSLLPHFTKLEAGKGHQDFHRLVLVLVGGIAGITIAVVLGLLVLGPLVMSHLFGQHYDYGRFGLALVGLGMGMHLAAGTLNQASLARGQARTSAVAWLSVAVLFLVWTLVPIVNDAVLRVEIGYAASTIILCGLLFLLYRHGSRARSGHQGAVLAEQVR